MTLILGIDEAGRGPCFGPMVMCGVLMDNSKEQELKELGVKDSKKLSPAKRLDLYNILKKKKLIIDYVVIKIPPYKIDEEVASENSSLNFLEAKTSVKIISKLFKDNKKIQDCKNDIENCKITIILDCPSINTHAYNNTMIDLLQDKIDPKTTKVISEHKADENYVAVSAASILAKVTRDKEIESLQKKYKKTIYGNIGSGYPSDVQTIGFIAKYWKELKDDKDLFRKTWETYKELERKSKQKKLFDF